MPLDGSNNYYYPLGTPGVPNQTIESEKYNTFLDDLVMNDLNVPRPVSRGGTGASTPEQARTNLGVMASAGGDMTGSIIVTGSITASTGPSAGIIYLGTDQTHYLQWDGTTYSLPSGPLAIGGNTTITGGLGATGNIGTEGYLIVGGTSNTGVVRFGHLSDNYLYFDGTKYLLQGGPLFVGGTVSAQAIAASGAGSFASVNATGTGSFGAITSGTINGSSVSASGAMSVGTNLTVNGTINSGGITTTSLTAAGTVSGAAMTVGGQPVWHAGNFNPGNYVPISGGSVLVGDLSATAWFRTGHGTGAGVIYFGGLGQNINFNTTNADGWRIEGGGGGFHIDTNAVKPGGGTWDAPSDGRVKTLLGEYEHGLEQITRLKPLRFKYTDRSFDLVKDREFIGFVAQDVEPVMPEMVSKKNGFIDGKEVKDFRMTDTTALIYALVNAVRELSDRVEELESAG